MSIIVKVNGDAITDKMLAKNLGRYIDQQKADENSDFELTKENLKYVKTETLNYLIERRLLLQEAARKGIAVSREKVGENIAELRLNYETAAQWEARLVKLGVEESELFDEIREDLTTEAFLNDLYSTGINFTEGELKAYYEDNEARMKEPDLFSFYEVFSPSAGNLKAAVPIVQSDDSFEEIETSLKEIGLEVENHVNIPAYSLPAEVLNIVADLEVGKIGTMAIGEGGYVMYKLNRRHIGKKLNYDSIKKRLAEYLIAEGKKEVYADLVGKLMEAADIEYEDVTVLNGL